MDDPRKPQDERKTGLPTWETCKTKGDLMNNSGGPEHARKLRIKRFIEKNTRLGISGLKWSERQYLKRLGEAMEEKIQFYRIVRGDPDIGSSCNSCSGRAGFKIVLSSLNVRICLSCAKDLFSDMRRSLPADLLRARDIVEED